MEVTIDFEDEELAQAFLVWMCEQGEQDMWMWDELAQTHIEYDMKELTMTITRRHPDGFSK